MRRLFLALLVPAVAIVPLAACSAHWSDDDRPGIAPTGSGGERHWAVSGFDGVSLGTSGNVEVRTGPAFSLTGTGDAAMLDMVKVTLDGHDLSIGQKRGVHWTRGGRLHFVVTMPRIARANIGGSGSIAVDRVEGPAFDGNIGGSGSLDLRGVRVQRAKFAIGGSGDVKAAGSAGQLGVSIGGSGSVDAAPLVAETADVSIAGSGGLRATVRRSASVTVVGSGDVAITGGAKCSVTKMGSGSVHCG